MGATISRKVRKAGLSKGYWADLRELLKKQPRKPPDDKTHDPPFAESQAGPEYEDITGFIADRFAQTGKRPWGYPSNGLRDFGGASMEMRSVLEVTMDEHVQKELAEAQRGKLRDALRDDLAAVINKHSVENESNTPDFILADFLLDCLASFEKTIQRRAEPCGMVRRRKTSGGRDG